jgi:hypothetical protein
LEAKLKTAKHLREKLIQLKSGKYFLPLEDLNQLYEDLERQRMVIHESSIAEQEIKELEEQIAEIKSSGRFVFPTDKDQISNRIETMQNSLTNANEVHHEIYKVKTDSGFCSKADIEKLQTKLNTVQNVLKKLSPLNPGKLVTDGTTSYI